MTQTGRGSSGRTSGRCRHRPLLFLRGFDCLFDRCSGHHERLWCDYALGDEVCAGIPERLFETLCPEVIDEENRGSAVVRDGVGDSLDVLREHAQGPVGIPLTPRY